MSEWMFLTNHARVLIFLANHPKITARELSNMIGITERAVRNIIADLEQGGYIEKTREGRRVKYKIHPELSLRHPTQKDQSIKSLLKALGCKLKLD
jgi:DNA-binding MarR family transcriptional regulator